MIFVDTSVWVAFFRGGSPRLIDHVRELLDADTVALAAPVRLELLAGTRGEGTSRLDRLFTSLTLFVPSADTWILLDHWVRAAAKKGERFGMADLLVGALATERGATVWTLDADFTRLQNLKLVRLHRPA